MNAFPVKHYTDAEIPSRSDLNRLSLRAMLGLVARCVRRSQDLYQSRHASCHGAIEQAIVAAEQFARGGSFTVSGAQIRFAVKYAGNRGSRHIAQAALYLAQATVIADQAETEPDAQSVVYKAWMATAAAYNANPELSWLFAARDDLDYLSVRHRGAAHRLGPAFEPGSQGPLGPIWGETGHPLPILMEEPQAAPSVAS